LHSVASRHWARQRHGIHPDIARCQTTLAGIAIFS
jgi:hypothetical protein